MTKKFQPIEIIEGRNYSDDTSDYHFICDINTTREERKKMNMGDIYCNQAKCLSCDEIVRSKNRHDYRSCSCGELFVDGGSFYSRRGGNAIMTDHWQDMSINFADAVDNQEK